MHTALSALVKQTAAKLKVPSAATTPPERFVTCLDLGRKGKKAKRAEVSEAIDALLNDARGDAEWVLLCSHILGHKEMVSRGKRWRKRWRTKPALMRDILGEIRFRSSDVVSRGAYAEKLWKKANQ